MDILSVCPMLLPTNSDLTSFTGYISVRGHHFKVEIALRSPGRLEGASFMCDWKLHQMLNNYKQLLHQRLQQSESLSAFLVELKSLVDRQIVQGSANLQPPPLKSYYEQLIADLEQLGWDRLCFIDSNFEELHLKSKDVADRTHTIKLHLNRQHPVIGPKCTVDLPGRFDMTWSQKSTLGSVIKQFEHVISQHQDFWNVMDDLDKNTWILEPEKPVRSAVYRRIAIGNNASLQINVDPAHPRMLPECRFLGAEHAVNPLREKLNTGLHRWDPEHMLLHNLQQTLEVTFPTPSDTTKEELSVECGICYAYRLEEAIPDQVCDDARCNQPFHQGCLYEWLRALPTSRQSFNIVFGDCPYCSKPITVKMPSASTR